MPTRGVAEYFFQKGLRQQRGLSSTLGRKH